MPDLEKVIKEIKAKITYAETTDQIYSDAVRVRLLKDVLELLKEQEAKTGKWIPVTNGRGGVECSICHDYAPSYQSGAEYLSKYCPNCGAKMETRLVLR